MWILEAIARVPLKKTFTLLIVTLGAGFLLLARFLNENGLYHPLMFALVALDLYMIHTGRLWKAFLLLPAAFLLSYEFNPQYLVLFSLAFPLVTGILLFRESFRVWKWLFSSLLFFAGIVISAQWQSLALFYSLLPVSIVPALHGVIFGFCMAIAFLPYSLRKDRVLEALDGYEWKVPSEPATLAIQTRDLYQLLRKHLSARDPKISDELEEFAEKTVHLCHQLHQIQGEVSKTNPEGLLKQMEDLNSRMDQTEDKVAKSQYQQALGNKKKQQEQCESLRNKSERMRAQILHYVSGMENMRFAYANQEFSSAADGKDSIEFFINMSRAETVYETSEAYQKLF